jgi:hypothetical protein
LGPIGRQKGDIWVAGVPFLGHNKIKFFVSSGWIEKNIVGTMFAKRFYGGKKP